MDVVPLPGRDYIGIEDIERGYDYGVYSYYNSVGSLCIGIEKMIS